MEGSNSRYLIHYLAYLSGQVVIQKSYYKSILSLSRQTQNFIVMPFFIPPSKPSSGGGRND